MVPAPEILPDSVNSIPTSHTNQEYSGSLQEMGVRPLEHPTAVQRHKDGTTTGNMDVGGPPKERQNQGLYGSGILEQHQ